MLYLYLNILFCCFIALLYNIHNIFEYINWKIIVYWPCINGYFGYVHRVNHVRSDTKKKEKKKKFSFYCIAIRAMGLFFPPVLAENTSIKLCWNNDTPPGVTRLTW